MLNNKFIYTASNGDKYLIKSIYMQGRGVINDPKCKMCDLFKGKIDGQYCGVFYKLTGVCTDKVFKLLKVKRAKK